MSDQPAEGPRGKTAKPSAPQAKAPASNGPAWKWLAGAAAALVVAVGGFFAWKNYAPSEPNAEIAANEAYLDEGAGPSGEPLAAYSASDSAAPYESADAPPASASKSSASASRPRAASREVPEAVIGVAANDTIEESEPVIVQGARRPVWARTPTAYRLSSAYPQRALERGREGEARIRCTVEETGALDCVRVSETPAYSGFGTAALRVARMYRHAPERWDGSQAAGTPVNLRVIFRLADERNS